MHTIQLLPDEEFEPQSFAKVKILSQVAMLSVLTQPQNGNVDSDDFIYTSLSENLIVLSENIQLKYNATITDTPRRYKKISNGEINYLSRNYRCWDLRDWYDKKCGWIRFNVSGLIKYEENLLKY
jgi:hypothetical protein